MSYLNVNDAPEIHAGASPEERAKYVADIKAAITPGEVPRPEPLDEHGIEQFLKLNNNSTEAVEFIASKREKQRAAEEAFNAFQLSRSGHRALNNLSDGRPGPELQALLKDAVAALKESGHIRS